MIVSIKTMDSIYFLDKKYTIDDIYNMLKDRYVKDGFIEFEMYNGCVIAINKDKELIILSIIINIITLLAPLIFVLKFLQ